MIHDAAFTDPARERRIFAGRLFVTALVVAVMAVIIIARYVDLQINRHQNFATHSDNNRVHVRPSVPSRGLIYDRNGELLADNRPTYNLTIVRERSESLDNLLANVSELIAITDEDTKRFRKIGRVQARKIRSAISPRLAINTLFSMGLLRLADHDQWLIKFYRLTVFGENGGDGTALVGFDLVHHLHRFDDTDGVPGRDLLANFNKRRAGW